MPQNLADDIAKLHEVLKATYDLSSDVSVFTVNALSSLKNTLEKVAEQLGNLPAPNVQVDAPIINVPESIVNVPAPVVNVPAPIVNVPEQTVDMSGVIRRLDVLIGEAQRSTEPIAFSKEDRKALSEIIDRLDKVSKKPEIAPLARGGGVSGRYNTQRALHTTIRDAAGNDRGANVTESNELVVIANNAKLDSSYLSAFGTLETGELTPIIQGDWVYGINTQLWTTPVTSGAGAAVDTNAARLRIQSGTAAAGYAYITSRRPVRYRAGQGTVARFTPLFTTGVADNIQLWGMGSIVSNAPYDGYFFGFNGTAFGIAHYTAGTPAWTPQSSWNGDKLDGSAGTTFNWNKTFGTPVMIKYPYLGYGDIVFYVQNPSTGAWVLAHTIRYANTTATTQLTNPTLQFIGYTKNSGNTSNMTMYSGSVGCFVSGVRSFVGNPKWGIDNTKTNPTTETSVIGLRNCTTYNGVTNRGLIRLNSLTVALTGTAQPYGIVRMKINATLGGTPAYTPINGSTADNGVTITSGNSITSYDTAATTVASGTLIFNTVIPINGNTFADLTPFDIYVAPGEILTISGFTSANGIISMAVNWTEDI